jgi:peptidoglycan/xylan/chitin deacetylase (PgdA/CDA1 family)
MLRRSAAAILLVVVLGGCGASAGHKPDHRFTTTANQTAPAPGGTVTTKRRHVVVKLRNAREQPNWRAYTGPVPILVYHALGPPPPGAPFPGLYVSYGDFKAEMAWLYDHGYQAVTLDEMMRAWFHGGTLPRKPIVITFDNGYPEQVRFAPNVMKRYGWPGVLNEITENHLKPRQIWPIIHMGWEVDSHSLTHPDLTDISATELRAQVADSRTYLRHTFHIPVNSFCYPSSRYDDAVVAAVKAAGYTNAVTEGHAYATSADPYLLPRFEIEGGVSELADDLLTTQPSNYGVSS